MLQVLLKFKNVFSKRPGLTQKYTHWIQFHDETSFVKRSYLVPQAMREAVERTLQEMLE